MTDRALLDQLADQERRLVFEPFDEGTGCVGTIASSGLPQLEDHWLVVETPEAFLHV